MMQIALQDQSDMGGNIDCVPTSHTDIRKHKQKFRKPLRVQLLLGISRLLSTLSTKFEIIQRIEVGLNCYICDIAAYIAGARKISSPPLNIIAWDHFLLHRGTPISPSRMQVGQT